MKTRSFQRIFGKQLILSPLFCGESEKSNWINRQRDALYIAQAEAVTTKQKGDL